MRGIISRSRRIAVLLAFVLLFALSAGICFFVPAFFGFVWEGYYTVLLNGGADIAEMSAALKNQGFENFVSLATASVEISDFDVTETVLLSDIPARLLPEDPRMDDFLKNAPALFYSASGQEHILYFPARESPVILALKLGKVFRDYSWSIVEWHTGRRLALFILFCIVVVFFVYLNPGIRLPVFIFSLPWFSFPVYGDPGVFAAGILVYFALVYYLGEAAGRFDHYLYDEKSGFWNRILVMRGVYGLILTGAAFLLVFLSGGGAPAFIPLAAGIAGSAVIGGLGVFYKRRRRARREHRLFIPLSILPKTWKSRVPGGRDTVPLIILCCLIAAPVVFRLSGQGGAEIIPKPRAVPEIDGFSRENLRRLWALRREDSPADFSDYLCHRAFQQGFFYGYPLEFPLPGARISLPRFSGENGIIVRREETLLKYDETWYKKELEKAEKPGIGNLLLRQGVSQIALEPAWRISLDTFWVFRYGIIIAVVFIPLLFVTSGRIFSPVPFVKNLELRRNQQEA
jgi:hypothetical protein